MSLLLGIGVATHVVPDSVESSAQAAVVGEPTSYQLVPTRPDRGRAWIEGTVVDRAGRYLDGIDVEAYDVDDLRGDPVASWQTYEDPEDGPEHGWFRLYGLTPGSYKIKFSSAAGTPKKARYRSTWSRPVTVGKREIADLGKTAITLNRKVSAKLTATVVDAVLTSKQSPSVRLVLSAAEVRPITGTVRVTVDRRRARSVTLRANDRGKVKVTLPAQSRGSHTATFTFAGNDAVEPSGRPVVVRFRVTRTGR